MSGLEEYTKKCIRNPEFCVEYKRVQKKEEGNRIVDPEWWIAARTRA